MISYELYQRVLWIFNGLMIVEAVFQLLPLFYGVPYASRRGCLAGAAKYFGTMVLNLLAFNWGMAAWLLVGFVKEVVAYIKLRDLKEGYKI